MNGGISCGDIVILAHQCKGWIRANPLNSAPLPVRTETSKQTSQAIMNDEIFSIKNGE